MEKKPTMINKPEKQDRPRVRFPSLFDLVRNRKAGLVLFGAATVLVLLNVLGLPSWVCPFRAIFHLDCPGCGMTRAFSALASFDIVGSWRLHPFAIIYTPIAVLMGILLVLPDPHRKPLLDRSLSIDRKWGISMLVLTAQLIYGIVRLAMQIAQ